MPNLLPPKNKLHNFKNASKRDVDPFLKFFLEMGPLVVFFFLNYKGAYFIEKFSFFKPFEKSIFLATAFFLVATIISFFISWHITKTLPVLPLITAIFVLVFGSLTLWFHNEIFIKIKPTIINLFFSVVLFGGLYFKKSLLTYVMQSAIELNDEGWHKLTLRFAFFFLFLALLNEIIWRNFSTEFWASFKVFGTTLLTFGFLASQIPLILKYTIQEKSEENKTKDSI